ncbi:MaoC/PaaZ C-terminal domain-containing protein [Allobranchiibius sp. GilTou73]|uniref:MaoC/PaaZ C-terminal domain-containing protein n=1 Tax=Allobranchiibius sp. GilTou73 TaxID=2904523 RepID=UPI001F18F831|nr:MaoC/PaaZ C-terminal domain-containing protein [Allobranchiibius sp. GilTou73]UIJ36098.1 hypothetical protein LVQ62_06925 [Allobranchiibius sp. GilTou73]
MTRTVELSSAPSLGPLFAQAVVRAPFRKGRELPDLVVRQLGASVDRDQLAAYDDVCGFALRDTLPATYIHVLVFPLQTRVMADAAFPFPLVGSVHLTNTIVQHRPVLAGELLDIEVRATDLRPHFRGAQVDLVAEVSVAGETVWQEVSTYLFRGQKVAGTAPLRSVDPQLPTVAGALWRVPGDIGRRYAAVAGDVNPIHLHPLGAKALGFPTTIAHGMWSASHALAALAHRLPDGFTYTVEFKKPILIPSSVNFVAQQRDSSWDLALTNARKGTVHMTGSIRAQAPSTIS